MARFAVLLAQAASALQVKTSGHPMVKVIDMLKQLEVQAQKELNTSETGFAKFQEWCRGTAEETNYQVGKDQKVVKKTEATLEALKAEHASVTAERTANNEKRTKHEEDLEALIKERAETKAAFDKEYRELTEAAEACAQAVAAIKATAAEMSDAHMDGTTVMSLLQNNKVAYAALAAQTPHATKFGGTEIITRLNELVEHFKEAAQECYDQEMGDKMADDKMMTEHKGMIARLTERIDEQDARIGELDEGIATNEKLLDETLADQEANVKFLEDLKEDCETKTKKFAENNGTMKQEIEALNQAIQILTTGVESGFGFIQHKAANPYKLDARAMQMKKEAEKKAVKMVMAENKSFLQMRAVTHRVQNYKLVKYLREQGNKVGSVALLNLALHAQADPFVKVRGLIEDMIVQLEEQAEREMDLAAQCKEEEDAAIKAHDEAQALLEKINADLSKLDKTIIEAKDTIAKTTKEIEDKRNMLAGGEEEFETNKANAEENLANAEGAQKAVDEAITALNEFYGQSFLQQPAPSGVTTNAQGVSISQSQGDAAFEPEHKAQNASGVLGLLETLAKDYSDEVAETEALLETMADGWASLEQELKEGIEAAEAEKDDAETTKAEAEADTDTQTSAKKDQTEVVQQQDEVLQALKKKCAATGMSFKERKAAREKEIKSLKEAMKILKEIANK